MKRLFNSCVLSKAFLVLYAALLSACFGPNPVRPESWPQPANTSEPCPDISGTYNNRAEGVPVWEKYNGFLYDEFTNEGFYGTHTCANCPVNITWVDADRQSFVITLTSYGNYGPSIYPLESINAKLEQSDGDFECRDGALIVTYARVSELLVDGIVESGSRQFEKAVDGSLLRTLHTHMFGHFLFYVPFIHYDEKYHRWLPYSPSPPSEQNQIQKK